MEKKKEQSRILPYGLTVLGYVLIILFLFITAPVVCPALVGQQAYTVSNDYTGSIKAGGTLVYARKADKESIVIGDVVAVEHKEGARDVDCYYVDSNDTDNQTITLRDGDIVAYDLVKGRIEKKTPFFGYLGGLCFHVWGIILDVLILAAGIGVTVIANKLCKEQRNES